MNYTKEFEDWWAATKQENKLAHISYKLVISYKEVAYAAWQEQENKIYQLTDKINYLEDEIAGFNLLGHTI